MDEQMSEAEDALTPLAEMLLNNAELVAEVEHLRAKIETVMPDIGDEIDAMCALRDTADYLSLKMREDRLNNPNYVQQRRERLEKDLQRMRERLGKRSHRKKPGQVNILEFSAENVKRLKCPQGAHAKSGVRTSNLSSTGNGRPTV